MPTDTAERVCIREPGHAGRCRYADERLERCANRTPSGRCRHEATVVLKGDGVSVAPYCEGHGIRVLCAALELGITVTVTPLAR